MSRSAYAGIVLSAALACSHEPEVPPNMPAAPTASATPVGYLLDDADLHLTADQHTHLADIDRALAAELAQVDQQLQIALKAAGSSSDSSAAPMRRGRGMRGGGGGGGMGGGGSGSGHRARGSGAGSGARADKIDQLTQARADDVRDALARSLALLDDAQKAAATKRLADRGVDLDGNETDEGEKSAADEIEPPEP